MLNSTRKSHAAGIPSTFISNTTVRNQNQYHRSLQKPHEMVDFHAPRNHSLGSRDSDLPKDSGNKASAPMNVSPKPHQNLFQKSPFAKQSFNRFASDKNLHVAPPQRMESHSAAGRRKNTNRGGSSLFHVTNKPLIATSGGMRTISFSGKRANRNGAMVKSQNDHLGPVFTHTMKRNPSDFGRFKMRNRIGPDGRHNVLAANFMVDQGRPQT